MSEESSAGAGGLAIEDDSGRSNQQEDIVMANDNPNQPKQNKPADQSKTQKPADTKPQGQDKGRTEDPKRQGGGMQRDGGESQRSDRASNAEQNQGGQNQGGKGDTNQKTRDDVRQPGAALPNPKIPHYGDNEPGDPRKTEIEAGRKGAVQNPADAGE